MLWFALSVIAVAGITLVMIRLWATHEPRQRLPRNRLPREPAPRPYAPDDDEEFLRSLSRKRD